jgi:hypothetical protein
MYTYHKADLPIDPKIAASNKTNRMEFASLVPVREAASRDLSVG